MGARRANTAGTSIRDAALLAVARVDAISGLVPPPWAPADEVGLCAEAGRQLSGQAHAAAMLGSASEHLVEGIELVPFLEPGGPFGPAWSGHPFASPAMTVGYKLREPDVTRELASLMGASGGRRASKRAVTFLRLVADLAGAEAIGATLADQTRPVVAAEHLVAPPRRRVAGTLNPGSSAPTRIDLLFEWAAGAPGQHAVVVVEAKLGSSIGAGQLRPYRQEALRRAKGGPVALILLTAWADEAERRHRTWLPVRWFQLLRRWERVLAAAGDDDPEFTRVRAHLWRFVLDSRRARH